MPAPWEKAAAVKQPQPSPAPAPAGRKPWEKAAARTVPARDNFQMIKPEARERVAAMQGERSLPMARPADPNAPNPITTAVRQSQADTGNAFAEEARRRQERRDASRVNMGDMLITHDDSGNLRPGTEADRDLSKAMMAATPNALSDLGEAIVNAPGDIAQTVMGGQRVIPRADLPRADMTYESPVGEVAGPAMENLMQFALARRLAGKVAPGGGPIASRAKDAASVLAGVDSDEEDWGRLADMVNAAVQESGSPDQVKAAVGWLAERDPSNPVVERLKNVIDFVLPDEAARLAGRGVVAADRALMGKGAVTPTNAGGARPGPVTPRNALAPRPSVAPVAQPAIPQAPPAAAQARPAGAGQQAPGGAQPALNAVPVSPTVSKAQAREAKDTAVILGRLMRSGGIKNDAIRRYLPGLIQRYESLGDSRVPLARFIERDLPQHFPEGVAGDVTAKLRGFGRERDASTGPKDTSRYTMQETKKGLRSSQQDHLTEVIRSNTYKKELIDAEDKIRADMRLNAEAGYETALDLGIEKLVSRTAKPEELKAAETLKGLMASEPFTSRIPEHVKVQAMRTGKTIEDMIKEDPFRTAHWLQSALGKAERAAQGLGGKATPESLLYKELRDAVLEPLENSISGYKGARNAHGDLFGADEALEFGEDLFLAARSEVETARKARDFNKLSKQQQTVATMSIRDKLLNEFRGTPEDAAAKLTRMQQEGVLNAIERILGADGKRITAAIRETVEENDWLRSIDQGSGSPTFGNAAGARDAAENVRGPINKAVGSLGDKRTYLGAVVGDVVLSSVGVPPVLTVGKATSDAVGAAGRPSARQLSNATKGLFGLPEPKPTGNALASPPRQPRAPRKAKPPEQLEADLETLLKQYDQVDHRNNPTESARILKKIDALKKKIGVPSTRPSGSPPDQAGFGGRPKPLPMDEASRMQRARQQGFDVDTPLFHGTNKDIEAFAVPPPSRAGLREDDAVFLTDAPDLASSYAKGEGANVIPVFARVKNPFRYDAKGENWVRAWPSAMVRAKRGGHDGVIVTNVDDWGDAKAGADARNMGDKILGRPRALRTVYAVFDPANIRSVNATFDPSETQSSKLLAGTGGKARGIVDNLKQDVALAGFGSVGGSFANQDDPQAGALGGMALALGAKYGGRGARALGNALKGGRPPKGPTPKGAGVSLQNAEKILADFRVARELSDEQLAPVADAINKEMRRLQTKTVDVNGERIPYSNTTEGYERVMRLNGLLMNAFKNASGEIDIAKAMRWAEKNDPDRVMRVEAGRAANDMQDGVRRTERATPKPPPRAQGFGGSGKGPAGKGPQMSGKVISELERAKKTLPPEVRNKLAANAAKPPALRVSAAEATGDDPSIYAMAAPFQRSRKPLIARRAPPNMVERGVNEGMARVEAQAGKPPPLDEAGEAVRLSERQRRAAKADAQTTANRLNPYANEAAGIPDKPLPKRVATREEDATKLAIASREMLAKHRLTANEYEQAVAYANARKAKIADALLTGRVAPPGRPGATSTGVLPGSAGQPLPPRRMSPVSRREADEMAALVFDKERAQLLDDVLSGRVVPRNRSAHHAALLLAAGSTIGAVGGAAVIADIQNAANNRRAANADQKADEPVYDNPGDPRFVWDWEKVKSERNPAMQNIQIQLNRLPPNASGGRYNLKTDGRWTKSGETDRAIRNWLYENGFDPNGPFTMDHWTLLDKQVLEGEQTTRAAPARRSRDAMPTP
jgi:hypothetical protein